MVAHEYAKLQMRRVCCDLLCCVFKRIISQCKVVACQKLSKKGCRRAYVSKRCRVTGDRAATQRRVSLRLSVSSRSQAFREPSSAS